MNLDIWLNRFYPQILSDFGFSRDEDTKSAKILYELGKNKLLDCSVLKDRIANKNVVVVGGAIDEADAEEILKLGDWAIITAGKSILKLSSFLPNLTPDVHVTDMEEDDEILIELERKGCILVLHAHGDNIDRIRSVVPKLSKFVATTQSEPFGRVYNFGGFTDGDRAVIIAKTFNAKSIKLVGFDFDKAEGIKLKKLQWARKILEFEGLL
jgi:uncharacterized Rossmann fold enzyme